MFFLFMVLTQLFISNSYAEKLVFETSVVIEKDIETVFSFAADAKNDYLWRTEVHEILTDGAFKKGTKYIEDAWLGWHYHYITEVELIELVRDRLAVYQTPKDALYFLKSERMFEVIEGERTKFTYRVNVNTEMIESIWGKGFPVSIAKKGYLKLMGVYLKKLKRHLEKGGE